MAAALALHLTGGPGNTDPALSLGGQPAGVACPATLFGALDAEACRVGGVEYRAVDLVNAGEATAHAVRVWLEPQTPSPGTVVDVGLAAAPRNSVAGVGAASVAPRGVSWAHPLVGSKLMVGEAWPAGWLRLWLRRTVSPAATALANDGATLRWHYV